MSCETKNSESSRSRTEYSEPSRSGNTNPEFSDAEASEVAIENRAEIAKPTMIRMLDTEER